MKRYRFMGNVYGEYELYKNLKFKTSFGVDFNSYSRSYYRPSTLPTSLDRLPPSVPEGSKRDKNMLNWVWENTLSYTTVIKDVHNLSAIAGWTAQKESVNTSLLAGNGYPNDLVHHHECSISILQTGVQPLTNGRCYRLGTCAIFI